MRAALIAVLIATCFTSLHAQEQAGKQNAKDRSVAMPVPHTVGPVPHKIEHSGKFGDLAVSVSKLVATPQKDRVKVEAFVSVANTGKGAICATFGATLNTTFNLQYRAWTGQPIRMQEMLPGESSEGSFVFDIRNGVQPLELIVALGPLRQSIRCGNTRLPGDAQIPNQIHFDVRGDLPVPAARVVPALPRSIVKVTEEPTAPVIPVVPAPEIPLAPGTPAAPMVESKPQPPRTVGYPQCISCPAPGLTTDARNAGFEGTLVLQVTIGPDGRASNIQITKSSGYADLDKNAIHVVQTTWRFKPALDQNGTPVPTITPIEITFRSR